jgi:hypothetical protein
MGTCIVSIFQYTCISNKMQRYTVYFIWKLCNVASCWVYIGILLAYPVLHISRIRVNDTCIFLNRFLKNTEMSNFMKIRPVGAEVLHLDGQTNRRTERQTDMTQLIVAFRNFANAPKPE